MKKITLVLIAVLGILSVRAQDEEQKPTGKFDRSKLFIGGNFGLSFGDYTLINISPQLGYQFNNFFAAGAGVTMIYSSFRYRYSVPDYRESYGVTGLNIFGRVYPIRHIFVQLQPELNYTWGKRRFYDGGGGEQKLDGKFVPSLLGGVGGLIPMGERGGLLIMAQYDLLQQPRSPYGNRVFYNVGFNFGL
ncbi:MAG: hypothetical protein H7Y31_12685 [Chitinophagaceae bacterium]|nr:hypothetical protein [Chitinophagaceae bacterium]